MTLVAGMRMRMINESIRVALIAALDDLSWFSQSDKHRPLHFAAKPADWADTIVPNTFSITLEDSRDEEAELGEQAIDDIHSYFFDFFADSEALGMHLCWDIHDVVMGLRPSIGRSGAFFDVYDLRDATPAPQFRVDVERCSVYPVEGFPRPWQRHWWTVRFDVLDYHDDIEDPEAPDAEWSGTLRQAWELVRAQIAEGG